LSFILPGMGGIAEWLGSAISKIPGGSFLVDIGKQIYTGASKFVGGVKDKIGQVFNSVTGAVEGGMNAVSRTVGGKGEIGSSFRNFVSDLTGGYIEKSEKGLELEQTKNSLKNSLTDVVSEDTGITDNEKLVKDSQGPKERKVFLDNLKDKDLSFKDKIITSKEYKAYKPIEAIRTAGAAINEGEAAYEAQVDYLKARKSDYFKGQADYQLSAVEQQNYSHVGDMPTFVDYSNFNASQDPAPQYLAYRGITGNVNPVDIGGYGFDYEQFLRAQLS
jgi:hypothetical protein